MGKAINARFNDTAKAVEKLRARGGKIVFVRFPFTGELKTLEDRLNPRTRDWERLLGDTKAPGIYFEDYPGPGELPLSGMVASLRGRLRRIHQAPGPPSSDRASTLTFETSSFGILHFRVPHLRTALGIR